jgi:hypothetical protein
MQSLRVKVTAIFDFDFDHDSEYRGAALLATPGGRPMHGRRKRRPSKSYRF